MNKTDMINNIAESTGLEKKQVEDVMKSFFDNVKKALKEHEPVKLIGFGTFSSNKRKAKSGRNPQTGEVIDIPARFYPKFKPGRDFREYLN